MVCVYCGAKTRVTNSRSNIRAGRVWRRRECLSCRAISTSREEFDLRDCLAVQHTDKNMDAFMRDTLYMSVVKSLDHSPHAVRDASALCETIVQEILKHKPIAPNISTTTIAKHTKKVLDRYDKTAAIKYCSYRSKQIQQKLVE